MDWIVTAGSVIVTLLLITGVTIVVLRAVCVTVTGVVVGVCKQGHTSSTSEDGRDRIFEKMLA